jgi:hypothetical protein
LFNHHQIGAGGKIRQPTVVDQELPPLTNVRSVEEHRSALCIEKHDMGGCGLEFG